MQIDLITDVDGVVLDWASPFRTWAAERLGPLPHSDETDLNQAHRWIGMELEESQPFIQQFQQSDALAQLPAYADALEFLPKLAARGYRLIAVSGCGTHASIPENRWKNLRLHFGDIFSDFIPLPYLVSKKEVLQRYKRGIWVDDAHYHALSGHEAGHQAFYMHRNLQPHQPGAPYEHVTDWGCVFNRLVDPTVKCC